MRIWITTFAALLGLLAPTVGFSTGPRAVGPRDRCPVCGMFVSRTPSWIASLSFRDGETAFFDGPKDLMRFYFLLSKYAKGKTAADIESLFVTEYYSAKPVPAQEVLYALGSDVLGPMGAELVPIRGRPQADAFARDHKAKRIVSFSEITAELLSTLE